MSKKVTIGFFIDTYFPMVDGVIMVVDNYARELSKRANVIVFAPYVAGQRCDDSIYPYKIVRCRSLKLHVLDYSLPIPRFDKQFLRELEKTKLDIVHIHSPFMVGKLGVEYAKKCGAILIGTMHSQIKKDFLRAVKSSRIADYLTRKTVDVYDACDKCFAVNGEVARIFRDDYGYKTLPDVINNATDMMPLSDYSELLNEIDLKFDIAEDDKVFLFVGRLNALKNIFFIVDSLKILRERYPDISFKMLFVGTGQDEKELRRRIWEKGLNNRVFLVGKITDRIELASYYKRADLFLFPSLYDASSLVQIEAACQCTPTLFLENSATSGTITANVNGFIAPNDPTSYADAIAKIIYNKSLYKTVSRNCQRDIYKTWSDVADLVYTKYGEMLRCKCSSEKNNGDYI